MRTYLSLAASVFVLFGAIAQVPQFSSNSFADWIYTNPGIELNSGNILGNRIVLYTNSEGRHLTLTSPEFPCHAGETIDMRVTWITAQWQDEGFNKSKVALTAAILDGNGVTRDSVTWTPTQISKTNYVDLTITVPGGVTRARLRFAAWKADVNSCGAVRQVVATSFQRADVNGDGEVTISDVNTIIDVLLGYTSDEQIIQRADVNADGEVTISDVNRVIDVILS